ncbi:hypothetical protein [Mycolicibacterium grossiae]|uniref:Alanine and proline-rich secreted protein Apa n=1 Tax=Mycolicibacterium grossiae TaxID=1552759 RepID=A0A1E8PYB5_9MYCO|nr:hypothetical protein [Mycolicibacterium grossiae]OFJ50684.1 hypothetical protein BEL07_26865 [Mycolicibacterium grossiae]QEM47659.1 hypothetical protein FZ046_25420 [Mycolicibacterium grossiae]
MKTTKVKLLAATAGAGAVLAMGGVTMATSAAEPADPAPPGPVVTSEATTGETSTESAAPTTPTTSSAAPEITGPAPLPPEEEGLPG